MAPLRDLIGRNLLTPALRVMRAQLRLASDPIRLRAAAAQVDALGHPGPGVRRSPARAGGVPATWIDIDGNRPQGIVLYLHGGAFVTETPVFHGALLGRICREARTRGLMISYRLAPEHPYPAALDDGVAAYRWLLEQGHGAHRIVVAGDSAGGNLTLALLLRLRDEGLPLPAGAVALSPVTDLTFSGESVHRNDGVDAMFDADMLDTMVPVYLPRRELCANPHVSPLFGDFTGLPPLLLVVGSTELLLDDSVRVAQRWPGATLLVWHGMPHVFPGFDFLPEARAATERIGRFVRNEVARATAATATATATPAEAEAVGTAEPAVAAEPPSGHGDFLPALWPRGLGIRARWYLGIAMASGALWLAVMALGIAPLLWLVSPLVWVAAAMLAGLWGLAVLMFWRESLPSRRTAPPEREPPPDRAPRD